MVEHLPGLLENLDFPAGRRALSQLGRDRTRMGLGQLSIDVSHQVGTLVGRETQLFRLNPHAFDLIDAVRYSNRSCAACRRRSQHRMPPHRSTPDARSTSHHAAHATHATAHATHATHATHAATTAALCREKRLPA